MQYRGEMGPSKVTKAKRHIAKHQEPNPDRPVIQLHEPGKYMEFRANKFKMPYGHEILRGHELAYRRAKREERLLETPAVKMMCVNRWIRSNRNLFPSERELQKWSDEYDNWLNDESYWEQVNLDPSTINEIVNRHRGGMYDQKHGTESDFNTAMKRDAIELYAWNGLPLDLRTALFRILHSDADSLSDLLVYTSDDE